MFDARIRCGPPVLGDGWEGDHKKLDWTHLPPDLQRQVILAMARILAQALQPPARQEARHESP